MRKTNSKMDGFWQKLELPNKSQKQLWTDDWYQEVRFVLLISKIHMVPTFTSTVVICTIIYIYTIWGTMAVFVCVCVCMCLSVQRVTHVLYSVQCSAEVRIRKTVITTKTSHNSSDTIDISILLFVLWSTPWAAAINKSFTLVKA